MNHICATLADIGLIIESYLLMKANRAGCWLGNTLLALAYVILCLKALLAQSVMMGGQPLPSQF